MPSPEPAATAGRGRHKWAAGALTLLVVVSGTVGAARWRGGRSEPVRLAAGPDQLVTGGNDSLVTYSSPSLAVSPSDPRSMVVAATVDRPERGAVVRVSRDGGRSWSDAELNLPPGQARPFEAQLAFDGKGTLYALFTTLEGPGIVPNGLWMETSGDAGSTFSAPVRVAGRFTYQPRLVVDEVSSDVHVTWLQADEDVVAGGRPALGLGPPPNPVMMASSKDGGATFPVRAQVSDPRRRRVGAASPVIAPDGDLFVLYQDYGGDVADFEGLPGDPHEGAFSLVTSRSTDGGTTFSDTGVVESELRISERFLVFLPEFPSLAVDSSDGTLYVAWSDTRNGDADVFVRRSDDRGKSWSSPVRVDNAEDSPRQQQYLPRLAVAPDGRVDILFLDRDDRADGRPTLALLSSSADKARSWDALRVSDQPFDADLGPRTEARGAEAPAAETGTNLGLASTADAVVAVWPDSRRGSPGNARQDLFADRLSVVRG